MIKLQDFAAQQGVTDRAIQKQLKKYASELEGQFERRGPNGTWLTDEACDFLRGKMKQQPMVIFEEDPRLKELEAKVADLQAKLEKKADQLLIAQEQTQRAQERVAALQEKVDEIPKLEAAKELHERELKVKDEQVEIARAQQAGAEAKVAELQAKLEAEIQQNRDLRNTPLWKRIFNWK